MLRQYRLPQVEPHVGGRDSFVLRSAGSEDPMLYTSIPCISTVLTEFSKQQPSV